MSTTAHHNSPLPMENRETGGKDLFSLLSSIPDFHPKEGSPLWDVLKRSHEKALSKSVDQMIQEQKLQPIRFDDFQGAGADIWSSDEEFDHFMEGLTRSRKES